MQEVNYIYAIPCPTWPSKFHVVALVTRGALNEVKLGGRSEKPRKAIQGNFRCYAEITSSSFCVLLSTGESAFPYT